MERYLKKMTGNCEVNQIFLGEVAAVQNYGAFVRIPGCSQQGLIHKSQVSSSRVDDVSEVLQRGERVWCKIISINDEGKISLSMKLVHQGNGTDLDPNGIELQKDEQRRKTYVPGQRKVIELQAVLNTTCSKCGTHGHLSNDCFMSPDGKKYELIPEDVEQEVSVPPVPEEIQTTVKAKKHKSKKSKSRKKSKKSKSSDDSDGDSDGKDKQRKLMKKQAKEKKRKNKRPKSESSDDSSTSDNRRKAQKRKSSDQDDKRAKKSRHSVSRH